MEKPSYFLYIQVFKGDNTVKSFASIEEYQNIDRALDLKKEYEDIYSDTMYKCYIIKGWKMS